LNNRKKRKEAERERTLYLLKNLNKRQSWILVLNNSKIMGNYKFPRQKKVYCRGDRDKKNLRKRVRDLITKK